MFNRNEATLLKILRGKNVAVPQKNLTYTF